MAGEFTAGIENDRQDIGRPYLIMLRQADGFITMLETLKPLIVAQRTLVNASPDFTVAEKTDAETLLTTLQARLDAL